MKLLVIGSGAREHAICLKLRGSKAVTDLFCAPGNPGISKVAECVPIKVEQIVELANFAESHQIDLTVVGPELPLSLGLVDLFKSKGLRIVGPTKAAAQIESSKSFAKQVMKAANVPTAAWERFSEYEPALAYIRKIGAPIVLKADGLAAGKGVYVCRTVDEAEVGIERLFTEFKDGTVLVERFLEGVEASYIVATDGRSFLPLATSHDYKRLKDGGVGPNTGGMGSVSPTPRLTLSEQNWVNEHIIQPVIDQMARQGSPFVGFLYAGLMISPTREINVVEFNCRLGDPECQVILERLESDFLTILIKLVEGVNSQAQLPSLVWRKETAVCVVHAAAGYPDAVRKGDEISGIEQAELYGVKVLHAGTATAAGKLITNGGRVLSVVSLGDSVAAARSLAYRGSDMVQFAGRQVRRDIGE